MKIRRIALLLLPLLIALCGAWGPQIVKGPLPSNLSSSGWPEQTNLVAWFDSRDATNVILNEVNQVTNWLNLVTTTDPATNYNAVYGSPYWLVNGGPNNYGYVRFYGTNWIEFNMTNALGRVDDPITVSGLYYTTDTNYCTVFGLKNNVQSAIAFLNWYSSAYMGLRVITSSAAVPNGVLTGVSVDTNVWNTFVVTLDHHNNSSTLFTNGVYAGSGVNGQTAIAPMRMGNNGNSMNHLHKGGIALFLVWSTILSSNDCVSLDQKIRTGFGL